MRSFRNIVGVTLPILALLSCRGHEPRRDDPAIFEKASVVFHYREDFRTGEVNAWDSYPPAQDTAFDPTFGCDRMTTGFFLRKRVTPNVKGPAEPGMIRRLSCDFGPHATLQLRYRVQTDSARAIVATRLCAADGRILTTQQAAVPGRWTSWTVRGSDFGITSPTATQAIIIDALIDEAQPGTTYALSIDDVEVTAHRPAGVDLISPKGTSHRHWEMTLIDKAYHPGDAPDLHVMPEIPLASLRAELRDPAGTTVGSPLPMTPRNNGRTWAGTFGQFTETALPGLWEARLDGETHDHRPFATSLFFTLVKRPPPRPRILASADAVAKLRAAAASAQKERRQRLKETAAQWRKDFTLPSSDAVDKLDESELLPTFRTYADTLQRTSKFLYLQSVVFAGDGDPDAGKAGKEALLAFCGWKRWVHPWAPAHGLHTYWPVGIASAEAAAAYDLLHPLLNEGERAVVRKAFLEKAILPAWREYVLADRIPFDTSNWIGIILGGAVACAAAIADEEEVDVYVGGMIVKLQRHLRASFKPDEGYGEGLGYQGMNLRHLTQGLRALETTWGIDLTTPGGLDRCADIFPYSLISREKGGIVFGDSTRNPLGGLHHGLAWLAWKYENGPLDRTCRAAFEVSQGDPMATIDDLLYPGDAKGPVDAGPPSRSFPNIGVTVMRSDWTEKAMVLAFKCGPNYNHHHADQGTFHLWAFGEELLTEAGATDYYEDPHYRTWFIQPAGHNCLLVDGDPESQRIGDFASDVAALRQRASVTMWWSTEAVDFVRGALHPVYRDKLRAYSREFIFLKPYGYIMLDRVETGGVPHQLTWHFHTPSLEGVTRFGNRFSIARPGARLDAHVNSDSSVELSAEPSIASIRKPKEQPGVITVQTNGTTSEAALMSLFIPAEKDGKGTPLVETMQEEGALGAMIRADKGTETFWARTKSPVGEGDLGGQATDASAWLLRTSEAGDSLTLWDMTTLDGPGIAVRSESPIHLTLTWSGGRLTSVDYCATSAHRLTVGEREITTAPGARRWELP